MPYDQDGITCHHNTSFLNDKFFESAYENTSKKVGRDFCWQWRNYIGIKLATSAKELSLNFVECGVGQGWMTMSIIDYIQARFNVTPHFTLFDTWEGIDEALVDKQEELHWGMSALEKKRSYKYLNQDYETIKDNILKTCHNTDNIDFIKGSIPSTFTDNVIKQIKKRGKISFLHIDMNNAKPEVEALKRLQPLMAKGGIILFDDYAYSGYEYQQKALDEACEKMGIEKPIALPSGQGLYINTI